MGKSKGQFQIIIVINHSNSSFNLIRKLLGIVRLALVEIYPFRVGLRGNCRLNVKNFRAIQ